MGNGRIKDNLDEINKYKFKIRNERDCNDHYYTRVLVFISGMDKDSKRENESF